MIRVLIVDDEPLQRDGYRMVLESQPDIEVVADVGDGAQALAVARLLPTDVVLMDIRLPRVSGIVATDRIRSDPQVLARGAAPRVVLVSALGEPAVEGAFAVLFKDADPELLLRAIRDAAGAE